MNKQEKPKAKTRTAPGMDRALMLIFAISEIKKDIKKFIYKCQNTFKSYKKFQSLKDLAQKLIAW